jgi:hypothetical protein
MFRMKDLRDRGFICASPESGERDHGCGNASAAVDGERKDQIRAGLLEVPVRLNFFLKRQIEAEYVQCTANRPRVRTDFYKRLG